MCHRAYTLKSMLLLVFVCLNLLLEFFPRTTLCSVLKTKITLQHTILMNRPHHSIKTVKFVYSCYVFWNQ